MLSALVLGLFGLLQVDVVGNTPVEPGEGNPPALVVVALPTNANRAILEALNRLRGEATSVGFEVRFVDAATESMTLARLDALSRGLRSAAVVAFAGPEGGGQSARALDVWFLDRASGKTSVAHLTADKDVDAPDRSEVVLAVRAVDFIRARMFDTLAGRQAEPASPAPQAQPSPLRHSYLAAGLGVLGGSARFSPALTPQIEVGYRWTEWCRVGATAFGFGTSPHNDGSGGRVSLDPRFVGATLTVFGRTWHRLQPLVEAGGGEFWLRVRGEAQSPSVGQGQTSTLSSPGASLAVGLAVSVLPSLSLELRAGTLWLQSQVRIDSTEGTYLGSMGRPTWLGSARLGASF